MVAGKPDITRVLGADKLASAEYRRANLTKRVALSLGSLTWS